MLKIEITTGPRNKFHAIPRFPTGPFAVYVGDHLRFGIISGLGIICGAVQCFPPPLRGADRGALYHVQCSVTVPHNPFRMGFSVYSNQLSRYKLKWWIFVCYATDIKCLMNFMTFFAICVRIIWISVCHECLVHRGGKAGDCWISAQFCGGSSPFFWWRWTFTVQSNAAIDFCPRSRGGMHRLVLTVP